MIYSPSPPATADGVVPPDDRTLEVALRDTRDVAERGRQGGVGFAAETVYPGAEMETSLPSCQKNSARAMEAMLPIHPAIRRLYTWQRWFRVPVAVQGPRPSIPLVFSTSDLGSASLAGAVAAHRRRFSLGLNSSVPCRKVFARLRPRKSTFPEHKYLLPSSLVAFLIGLPLAPGKRVPEPCKRRSLLGR